MFIIMQDNIRKEKLKKIGIEKYSAEISDELLNVLYDKLCGFFANISKDQKLKELGFDPKTCMVDDDVVNKFYYDHLNFKQTLYKNSTNVERSEVILELINKILEEINYEKINSLLDFKVYRREIIGVNGEKFVTDNKDLIKKGKIRTTIDLRFDRRNKIQTYILTVIDNLARLAGHEVKSKREKVYDKTKKTTSEVIYYVIA